MLTSLKKKLLLLALLVVIFAGFLISRYIILNNQDVYGRLKIVSSPSAAVFIDNAPIGRTPFENKYKEGEYAIKLIPEGKDKEIASWHGKVRIYKNSLTYIDRELGSSENTSGGEILTITKMEKKPENSNLGEIYVETEPNGALVYLDNDGKGTAPFILERVLKGDHELSAYMPGFLRRTQKINVTEGYRVNVVFKLALDPNYVKPIDANLSEATQSATISATLTPLAKTTPGVTKNTVIIQETPIGYLRVREEPSITASESAQVKAGEKYEYTDEQSGWYKIKLSNKEGWISSEYATKE